MDASPLFMAFCLNLTSSFMNQIRESHHHEQLQEGMKSLLLRQKLSNLWKGYDRFIFIHSEDIPNPPL